MGPLGWFHTALGFASLAFAAGVLVAAKGTRTHKRWGLAYAIAMALLNGTAFGLYGLFGAPGPFHALALVSLATLGAGLWPLRRREGAWLDRHAFFMAWSVVGLVAATAAEAATRLLPGDFGVLALGSSLAVVAVGGVAVHWRLPHTLRPFRHSRYHERPA